MNIFARKPTAAQPTAKPPIMRFLTLGGATVTVTHQGGESQYYAHCSGCGWRNFGTSYESSARDNSNSHAGSCRAMPKPEVSR